MTMDGRVAFASEPEPVPGAGPARSLRVSLA